MTRLSWTDEDIKDYDHYIGQGKTPEEAEEIVNALHKFTSHYMAKDENGKLKNDIFADLKKMNTNEKGQCKCIQCDKIFKYDSTGVNMCKRCVGEMF